MSHGIVKVIYQVSQKVMSITDDELKELQEMTDEQKNYVNPLKCAKQVRLHALAEHNQKVIDLIKALRDLLLADKDLSTAVRKVTNDRQRICNRANPPLAVG